MVLGAWDAFLDAGGDGRPRPAVAAGRLAGARDLRAPRLLGRPHRAGRPDRLRPRRRRPALRPDVDAVNARVTAAHRDASREEVLAALRRNRDATARYLAEEPVELDTAPDGLRRRPRSRCSSVVLGQAYELAVHGLDLVSCGAAPPPPRRAAVRPRRARRRHRRAGRVDGHHRRGHPRDPGRRLGVRLRRRRLDGAPGAAGRVRTARPSRRRRTCCSRPRPAGSTRCRPWPAAS